jgi:monovalent cation:H+ antiporter, CPA1 family
MNDLPIVTLGLILLTASLVAMFTRQVKLPYTVGLVVGRDRARPLPGVAGLAAQPRAGLAWP